MSLIKLDFELLKANRFIFDTPETGSDALPQALASPQAPEQEPAAGQSAEAQDEAPEVPRTAQRRDAVKEESSIELGAIEKEALLKNWMEKGIGNKSEAKEDEKVDCDFMSAVKDDPGSFALVMLATNGNFEQAKAFIDENTGKFNMSKIVEKYPENVKNEIGFYYDGSEWTAYDAGWASDNEYGDDFLTAWPEIVDFMESEDYDEFDNVPKQKQVIKDVSYYIALAGGKVEYSGGSDVANQGVEEGNSGVSKVTEVIIDWFKSQPDGKLVSLNECGKWKEARAKFMMLGEGLYKYTYDKDSDKIYAIGIAGTQMAGKIKELNCAQSGVNWRDSWTEVSDKQPVLEKIYGKMDGSIKRQEALAIAAERGEISESLALSLTEKLRIGDTITLDFQDENKCKNELIDKIVKWLEKQKDSKGFSSDKLNEIANIKADALLKALEKELSVKEGYGWLKYKATFKVRDGAIFEAKLESLTPVADAAEDGKEKAEDLVASLDNSGKSFVAKFAATLGGPQAAAKFYKNFEKIPFGLGPQVAVIAAGFLGPIIAKFKGGITGALDRAGQQAGIDTGALVSVAVADNKMLSTPGRLQESKVKLSEKVVLTHRIEVEKITTPEKEKIIKGGKEILAANDTINRKVTLDIGTELPIGTYLEGAKVLENVTNPPQTQTQTQT